MRVVVAPDKFKGSLSAPEVAARVAGGIARTSPGSGSWRCRWPRVGKAP